jgi:hypothetical protein
MSQYVFEDGRAAKPHLQGDFPEEEAFLHSRPRLLARCGVPLNGSPQIGGLVIRWLRRHFTYANVMATLAVFIALGGSSYAALNLTGRDIRDGSLSSRDLKRNTLGGTRIKESQLGKVRRARNADRLGGSSAGRFLVRCPRDTVPVSDVCVETTIRTTAPYQAAAVACEGVNRRTTPGRRLPSHDELMTAIGDYGIALAAEGELTKNVYPSSGGQVDVLVVTDAGGSVALTSNTAAGAKPFRCVADPLN